MLTFDEKLAAFCTTLEAEMNSVAPAILNASAKEKGFRGYHEIDTEGRKTARFVRVFTSHNGESRSVRYFVERETGIIFGAKGWKAYNPNRQYGTLDSVADWDWSGYYGEHKGGESSLVPAEQRR